MGEASRSRTTSPLSKECSSLDNWIIVQLAEQIGFDKAEDAPSESSSSIFLHFDITQISKTKYKILRSLI